MTAKKNEKELVEFLKEERESNQKKTKRTWQIGGALILIVSGYMFWMVSSLQDMVLNPQSLAAVLTGKIYDSAPQYIDETEKHLKAEAPKYARQVSSQIMDLFATLRSRGEEGIDMTYKMIPALDATTASAVEAHFELHGDDIKAFYEGHENPQAAEKVMDGLIESVMEELDRKMKLKSGDGLGDMQTASLENFRKINSQLKTLVRTPPHRLTKAERMQRRVIVSWIRALDQEFKDQRLQMSMLFGEE